MSSVKNSKNSVIRTRQFSPTRLSFQKYIKFTKIKNKNYAVEMLQASFLQGFRASASGWICRKYSRNKTGDTSDSPLPLHSHPADDNSLYMRVRAFTRVFFLATRQEEEEKQNSRTRNVGMPQVIQLPYPSTRRRSSAKIVFGLPTIHLRRLSGPSHPWTKHARETRFRRDRNLTS